MEATKCIIAIVERGKAEKIVAAAKKAGAIGATIFYGRGTGENEALKFFNLKIEASKEMILTLTGQEQMEAIYNAMFETGKLGEPGAGIIFTLAVENLRGLQHRKTIEDLPGGEDSK